MTVINLKILSSFSVSHYLSFSCSTGTHDISQLLTTVIHEVECRDCMSKIANKPGATVSLTLPILFKVYVNVLLCFASFWMFCVHVSMWVLFCKDEIQHAQRTTKGHYSSGT